MLEYSRNCGSFVKCFGFRQLHEYSIGKNDHDTYRKCLTVRKMKSSWKVQIPIRTVCVHFALFQRQESITYPSWSYVLKNKYTLGYLTLGRGQAKSMTTLNLKK